MVRFSIPRGASDIATVILGRHEDREIPPDLVEQVIRQTRTRIDLMTGSKASETFKEDLLEKILVDVIREPLDLELADPQFRHLDEFEMAIRQRINQHCQELGLLRDGDK